MSVLSDCEQDMIEKNAYSSIPECRECGDKINMTYSRCLNADCGNDEVRDL